MIKFLDKLFFAQFCFALCKGRVLFGLVFFFNLVGGEPLHLQCGEKNPQLLNCISQSNFGKSSELTLKRRYHFQMHLCTRWVMTGIHNQFLLFYQCQIQRIVTRQFSNALNIQVSFKGSSVSLSKIIFPVYSEVCFLLSLFSILPTSKEECSKALVRWPNFVFE